MRTADSIEAGKTAKDPAANSGKSARPVPENLKPFCFKPGVSGNPSGRPKKDFSAILAQHVFEGMSDDEYAQAIIGFRAQLRKGNGYTFKELADRGYGKLKEVRELTGKDGAPLEFHEVSEKDLNERIKQLERDLGLAREIDEAGRAGIAAAGVEAAGSKA